MVKIKDILDRLINCKFESAYEYLLNYKNIDKKILKEFERASIELGNCGWGGTLISDRADYLSKLLGYKYDEEKDDYVKIKRR